MGPLRTICILVLGMFSAGCAAQPASAPPKGAEKKPAEEAAVVPAWRLPFLFDGSGVFRSDLDSRGWYGAEVQFRVGVDRVFGDVLHFNTGLLQSHQLSFDAAWERGFGTSPNPQRFWATTGYSFGVDFYGDTPGEWKVSLSRNGGFPMTRSTLFSGGTGLAFGYHYGEGTQAAHDANELDHRGAIRVQHWLFFGIGVVEFRLDAALNLNVDPGIFAEPEFGAGIRLGRPISPVFVHVGWTWLPFERGGGHFFTLKLGVAL